MTLFSEIATPVLSDQSRRARPMRRTRAASEPSLAVLLLVAVSATTFFALVRRNLTLLAFFSAGHITSLFVHYSFINHYSHPFGRLKSGYIAFR